MKKIRLFALLLASLVVVACNKNAEKAEADASQANTALSAEMKESQQGADHAGHDHEGHDHATNAQVSGETAAMAKIQFDNPVYNFGTVSEGTEVEHTFEFTNTGDSPLIISDVKPSCGCTTPDYTKEPIAPNQKGKIVLKFDSKGKAGNNDKATTVFANVPEGTVQIRMVGMVEKMPDAPFRK
ncbi:DUF1573 domain-containing protein [Hugenholtzia roseola]|uniref:DUF1573 domain-containing protein n=1 Tax=Hugenholtzia roseola TaxID=1002 RepID=UPI000421AD58|nr:DUF1573 domain-containing protein [Hugenholtzia roseola]